MSSDMIETILKDHLVFKNGKTSPLRDDNGIFPVYGSNGIIGYSNEYNSPEFSIIIGRVGSYCGSVYFSKEKCWITDNAISCNSINNDESLFWFYLLNHLNLNQFRTGSGQPLLNQTILNSIKARIPQIKEKRLFIGHILSHIDSKIQNNDNINVILESIAQTLFKSWFVDFDPVKAKIVAKAKGEDPQLEAMMAISGKTAAEINQLPAEKRRELADTADLFPDEMEDSELGEIPKGWKAIPLYETAEYVNGGVFKANDFSTNKEGLPVIKIAELKSGISDQTEYTIKEFPEKYRINSGDILYSWSGSPETSLEAFKWFGGEGWLNQHIFKINTKTAEQKIFVYFLLKYLKPVLIDTAKNKQTTGLGHVTVADMKRIKVVFPDKKAIRLIQMKMSSLFLFSSNSQKQNIVLEKLRNSLIPKLISGGLNMDKKGKQ